MSLRTLLFGTFTFILLWFLGWQAWSIYSARARTDSVFAPFRGTGSWDALAPDKQAMLLAAQDAGFFGHHGVDWRTPGTGRTITEALAERLYVGDISPGISRLEATLIAVFVIHPLVDKRTQLDAYLATAAMGTHDGQPVTGLGNAARAYFRAPVDGLSPSQFARLVAMLEDPDRHTMNSEANWQRTDRILALAAGECQPRDHDDVALEGCAGAAR